MSHPPIGSLCSLSSFSHNGGFNTKRSLIKRREAVLQASTEPCVPFLIPRPFDIYIYILDLNIPPFEGESVTRLSLGRRLVNLLPVAKRTNALPIALFGQTVPEGRAFLGHCNRGITQKWRLFSKAHPPIWRRDGAWIRLRVFQV